MNLSGKRHQWRELWDILPREITLSLKMAASGSSRLAITKIREIISVELIADYKIFRIETLL